MQKLVPASPYPARLEQFLKRVLKFRVNPIEYSKGKIHKREARFIVTPTTQAHPDCQLKLYTFLNTNYTHRGISAAWCLILIF